MKVDIMFEMRVEISTLLGSNQVRKGFLSHDHQIGVSHNFNILFFLF